MSDFVKELNFDGDTFNDMKRDMNFVLQRLLGNMQEKECQEGTLTLKLDVSLVREYVPNYNPNIPGESREIAKPKFSHKVTSQMKVEDMKKGNLDTEMELFLNEETGEYEMRPVADTTQRSIFDADYRDVTEPGPAGIEPDNGPEYIERIRGISEDNQPLEKGLPGVCRGSGRRKRICRCRSRTESV